MLKVLVTGGAGYIGSMLVPQLLPEHHVTVLDSLLHGGQALLPFYNHGGLTLIRGDIRDADAVREAFSEGQDVVVHLAALVGDAACSGNSGHVRAVNVTATEFLLDLAQEAGVKRFLFASTSNVYGATEPGQYATEETSVNPLTLYDLTKAEAERAVLDAGRPGFHTLVMRVASVFGISGRPRFDLILNEFCFDAMVDHYLIVYWPNAWRSHVHVSDLAYNIGLLLEHPLDRVAQIINVGGHNRTKTDLVRALRHFAEFEYTTVYRGTDPRDCKISFDKARAWGLIAPTTPEMGILEVASALSIGIVGDPRDPRYRNGKDNHDLDSHMR